MMFRCIYWQLFCLYSVCILSLAMNRWPCQSAWNANSCDQNTVNIFIWVHYVLSFSSKSMFDSNSSNWRKNIKANMSRWLRIGIHGNGKSYDFIRNASLFLRVLKHCLGDDKRQSAIGNRHRWIGNSFDPNKIWDVCVCVWMYSFLLCDFNQFHRCWCRRHNFFFYYVFIHWFLCANHSKVICLSYLFQYCSNSNNFRSSIWITLDRFFCFRLACKYWYIWYNQFESFIRVISDLLSFWFG